MVAFAFEPATVYSRADIRRPRRLEAGTYIDFHCGPFTLKILRMISMTSGPSGS